MERESRRGEELANYQDPSGIQRARESYTKNE